MRALFVFVLALGWLVSSPAHAADATKPHSHQGILPNYAKSTAPPPVPDLTADDLAALDRGETVRMQIEVESGGRGVAVQDIAAPPDVVWSKITNYPMYTTWVEGVYACNVYEKAGEHIKAYFMIGAMGVKVEYFIDHIYRPSQGYMTWTLDYTRESDLEDSVGFWRVMPHPSKPGWSRVYYSVDVRLRGWVPGFIESMITKKGLIQATEWVKRESEAATATP